MKIKALILAAVLALGISYVADAAIITGSNGLEGLGSYTAEFEFSYDSIDNTLAAIDITLENTSDPANGGYITGFVFNLPEAWPGANVTFEADYSDFELMTNPSANPFGDFDLGAALDASFVGGGAPQGGIGVGETGQFTFNFDSDESLAAFADSDFLSQYSTGGSYSANFLVRFRGFDNDGSDKVPTDDGGDGNDDGDDDDDDDDPDPVPEPGSLFIFGLGLLGLFLKRNS